MQHRLNDRFADLALSSSRIADLRSDHAGEHGAVAIYAGILTTTRSAAVRRFARQHLRTELKHRRFFERWLPARYQSRLLPLWWRAGWLLGASAALFGANAVFRTIAAVESFVERHYQTQIDAMANSPELAGLRRILQSFCDDEVAHRDEAAALLAPRTGRRMVGRLWATIIGVGSAAGVAIARRL